MSEVEWAPKLFIFAYFFRLTIAIGFLTKIPYQPDHPGISQQKNRLEAGF
jgi:hypothetical protein